MIEISCEEVRRALVDYTEDDLDRELRARIESHLETCGGCRAIYDGVRNILCLVSTGEIFALPQGFSQRLFHRLTAN